MTAGAVEFRDPPPEADREEHRRTGRGHARREGEHAAGRRRQPGVQRPGRPELQRRSCRRSRRRFASGCSTITRPRRATGTCRWPTTSKAGATPRRRDGTLCCVQPLIAPLNSAKPTGGSTSNPRRAAAARASKCSRCSRSSRTRRRQAGRVVPRGAEGRVRLVRQGRSPSAPASRLTPGVRHRVQPLQATRLPPGRQGQGRPQAEERRRPNGEREVAKAIAGQPPAPAPTKDALEVTFHPDYSVHDGRFAMNPWLQELPDPITKLVWDNAAIISPKTAAEFGLKHGDLVKLTVNGTHDRDAGVRAAGAGGLLGRAGVRPVRRDADRARPRRRRDQRLPAPQVERAAHRHRLHAREDRQQGGPRRPRRNTASSPKAATSSREDVGRERSLRSGARPRATHHEHARDHGPTIGIPPDGHLTEEDLKKGFQGGYGNPQQPPAPANDEAGAVPARPRPPGVARQPVPVGHGDRPDRLHRLLGVHDRLPGREQHPGRRQARGEAQPRDALDPHRPLLLVGRPHGTRTRRS